MVKRFTRFPLQTAILGWIWLLSVLIALAQAAPQKTFEKPSDKAAEAPNAAQIELLETNYRYETNGDSRKEVHARVKLNSELGVRQFARLNFDYNRSFQAVEIPLVRITHANGGIADILPSAVTDLPNPMVVDAPAYQEVRVKSVRILGLQPGDFVEYRVVTTIRKHPLAPDFWMEHSFDRTGVVTQEVFTLELPETLEAKVKISPSTPATSIERTGEGKMARVVFRWRDERLKASAAAGEPSPTGPDVGINTLSEWNVFSSRFADSLYPASRSSTAVAAKAAALTTSEMSNEAKLRSLYDFVAQKIRTTDLPLGSTGYKTRTPDEILTSGYANSEDKAALLCAFLRALHFEPLVYLALEDLNSNVAPLPALFQHIFVGLIGQPGIWMDPSSEVAPFGMVSSVFRGKSAFCATAIAPDPTGHAVVIAYLPKIPDQLPFDAFQKVGVDSALYADGKLTAKVKYELRGDNELLLRVAFHQAPKEKWQEIAQFLALADGFRGKVTKVTTSDPYATKEPFTVEYEIEQAKFTDWTKKPVRIPALLPLPALPDLPAKGVGASSATIELGTPLEVELTATVRLPTGTTAQTPTGTSVKRDYATFSSEYSAKDNVIRASRRLHFLLKEIPSDRAADYATFLHAVQNDQAQFFALERLQTAGTGQTTSPPKAPKP